MYHKKNYDKLDLKCTIKQMKIPSIEWENIFAKHSFEKGFEFGVYKEHLHLNNFKSNN